MAANCAPGLPSYWLWDSGACWADYLRTGDYFAVCDFPTSPDDTGDNGVLTAHIILRQLPKALRVQYPFAPNFHFAIRQADQTTLSEVASDTGIPPADVAMALFCGAVMEATTATVDTTSGAINQAIDDAKKLWTDAASQNYYQAAEDAYADTQQAPDASNAASRDMDYYDITVTARKFSFVEGGQAALVACKAAFAANTSIGAALDSVAGPYPHLQTVASLHHENEARALQATQSADFQAFATVQGAVPQSLAAAWLRDAGAAPFIALSPVALSAAKLGLFVTKKPTLLSHINPAVLNSALLANRDVAVAPVQSPSSLSTLYASAKSSPVVVGGAVVGAGVLAALAVRRFF